MVSSAAVKTIGWPASVAIRVAQMVKKRSNGNTPAVSWADPTR
jgi:hypothetical protein